MNHVWQHPIFKGMVGVAAFVIVAESMVLFIPLAWAVSVPVTDRITIELGELPQWIIALVAFGGLWKAWRAEKAAVAVKTDLSKVQDDVKLIERNTNSLTKQIEANALLTGERIGKDKQTIIAAESAEKLAEGQRQGREIERASVAAQGATTGVPAAAIPGKKPVPVADERTAEASERVATATERSAAATVRVADATEVNLTDGKK